MAVGPFAGALVLGDVDAVGVHEDEPPHIRAQTPRALHGGAEAILVPRALESCGGFRTPTGNGSVQFSA